MQFSKLPITQLFTQKEDLSHFLIFFNNTPLCILFNSGKCFATILAHVGLCERD